MNGVVNVTQSLRTYQWKKRNSRNATIKWRQYKTATCTLTMTSHYTIERSYNKPMKLWQLTIEYRDGCVNKLYEVDPYYLLFYAFTVFNGNNKVKKLKLKTVFYNKKEV